MFDWATAVLNNVLDPKYLPATTALVTVSVTQACAIIALRIQANRTFRHSIESKKIERLRVMLGDFYHPLITLFKANSEIFRGFGPPSFSTQPKQRAAAAKVWKQIRNEIFKNNQKIRTLLMERSDLVHLTDNIDYYLPLHLHILSYEAFTEIPNEVHRKFFYPKNMLEHVSQITENVTSELRKLEGNRK